MSDPAPLVPDGPCSNCGSPWAAGAAFCTACRWTRSGPSPELQAAARRWAIGLGWWGVACFLVQVTAGVMLLEGGEKRGGLVLILWAAMFGAGVLVAAYHRGAGILILAIHSTTLAFASYLALTRTVGVDQARQVGLSLLVYLLNSGLFAVGAWKAGRAERGGNILIRIWFVVATSFMFLAVAGSAGRGDLLGAAIAMSTIATTIVGVNVIKGGERGFRLPSRSLLSTVVALGSGAVFAVGAWQMNRWLSSLFSVSEFLERTESMSTAMKVASFVIIAPAAEEILFRGAIQARLRASWDAWSSVLTTSAVFALVHVAPISILWIFALGVAIGALREWSGSLLPGFLLHALNNALILMVLPQA